MSGRLAHPVRIYGARRSVAPPSLAVGSALALPAGAATWDVRQWATYADNQIGERCVGEMLRQIHCIAVRGAGKRLSARGAYENGRAREVASAKGAPIPDVGSNPSDVIDAAIDVGVFAEDERENDENQTELETFAESTASVLIAPGDFVPLPTGDTGPIDQIGTSGYAVGFCMDVFHSYENVVGAVVWPGPSPGELSVGGHAQAIVASVTLTGVECYAVWGSWGQLWADKGTAYIPKAWVVAAGFGFVAMTKGPVL